MIPQQQTFSLAQYYGARNKSDIVTKAVLIFLILLILGAPLPFGSVQAQSIFWIEVLSVICFLFWIIKLVFFGNSEQLKRFHALSEMRKQMRDAGPFFYRHPRLAGLLN